MKRRRRGGEGPRRVPGWLLAAVGVLMAAAPGAQARQEIERPGPPAHEDFEGAPGTDGAPEGWYNLRDAKLVPGGVDGPNCLRFDNARPGRPARASRAFGVDGRQTEAVVIGLWARLGDVLPGERLGEEPGLVIDFLDEDLRAVGRGILGPWKAPAFGDGWVRVARRIPVPPSSRDALLSVGLLGATGTLEVDGLTIETVPVGGSATTNLVLNGDLELGDPAPEGWVVEGGARRVFPGRSSDSALELSRAGARAQVGLSTRPGRFEALEVRLSARGNALRSTGGARTAVFFLDQDGRILPAEPGTNPLFHWVGSFDWREQRARLDVPPSAYRAVLQFEKADGAGAVRIDNIEVVSRPEPSLGNWTPYHEQEDTEGWYPYQPAEAIVPGSALDASSLLLRPAGTLGRVIARAGRLAFERAGRARFFGVVLLSPGAYVAPEQADVLADRLARSGVNLVRLTGLDVPLGPGRSLFDDARDDTAALDADALRKLDHLIAALESRGIYIAIELQGMRIFRAGDKVTEHRLLPPGGGPAAAFDPTIRQRAVAMAKALLEHVNPETNRALRDDPALAWVTLAGELSLFDLIHNPNALTPRRADALRERMRQSGVSSGRRFWQATESDQWAAEAQALREAGLKALVAGGAHWRREAEYGLAQAGRGLDLIDDKLYWSPPAWGMPEKASLLADPAGLAALAARKRRPNRPYVVGECAEHSWGAWALPFEGADLLVATRAAVAGDWDALVRRGVAPHPVIWGAGATGSTGPEDLLVVPEAINGNPTVFALLPHAASLMLRGRDDKTIGPRRAVETGEVLAIDSPLTAVLAGWTDGRPLQTDTLTLQIDSRYAAVAVSAVGRDPLKDARRVLVTAVARAQPTGFAWADCWRHAVADPGRPPLLMEPVRARVFWRRRTKVKAYALDSSGRRDHAVAVQANRDGVLLRIDAGTTNIHWELVAE